MTLLCSVNTSLLSKCFDMAVSVSGFARCDASGIFGIDKCAAEVGEVDAVQAP